MADVIINLQRGFFPEKEQTLLEAGGFTASVFRYQSGVEAIRVKNTKGEFIFLPYKGQQIWRASFCGRELTMKSMFDEPAAADDFLATYGCFMLHCGITAMGNPAPEDTHAQHGELPGIAYDSAYIGAGEDSGGRYIKVGGMLDYKRAFSVHYTATPEVKLYENGTIFDISMTVENKRSSKMEYLYLCHVNFRPVEGAKLKYDAECLKIHRSIPPDLDPDKKERANNYLDALEENPSLQDIIDKESQTYEPEIVSIFDYKADAEGWTECLQVLPDGSADVVACRKAELPVGLRWISRSDHEDAMGMLLPSTAEHLGYNYCKKNGQIKYIPANGSIIFKVKAGLLEA